MSGTDIFKNPTATYFYRLRSVVGVIIGAKSGRKNANNKSGNVLDEILIVPGQFKYWEQYKRIYTLYSSINRR